MSALLPVFMTANLIVRFGLELCALAIYAYWGVRTGSAGWAKTALGLGAPLAAAVLWGTFGSPNAAYPVSPAVHLLLELVVFGLPAALLFAVGKPGWGWIYGAIVVANRALMAFWEQ
ncbi:DUF2568 domain-containing protein [Paenibacillus antri]|uniref:DUF2568 domain-containing protein n=1 Tax=Paenibacillus antri TaxID=2582848 RepID=A0A5R9GIQ1_9BACL|nr:YrdB family protein [Paenibacillus antri]TLS53324.1 DUF2568 domain-containing protein [Paenibacillus antri]